MLTEVTTINSKEGRLGLKCIILSLEVRMAIRIEELLMWLAVNSESTVRTISVRQSLIIVEWVLVSWRLMDSHQPQCLSTVLMFRQLRLMASQKEKRATIITLPLDLC